SRRGLRESFRPPPAPSLAPDGGGGEGPASGAQGPATPPLALADPCGGSGGILHHSRHTRPLLSACRFAWWWVPHSDWSSPYQKLCSSVARSMWSATVASVTTPSARQATQRGSSASCCSRRRRQRAVL